MQFKLKMCLFDRSSLSLLLFYHSLDFTHRVFVFENTCIDICTRMCVIDVLSLLFVVDTYEWNEIAVDRKGQMKSTY